MNQDARGLAAILFAATVWGTTGTAATFAPAVGPAAVGAAAMGFGGLAQAFLAAGGIRHHAAGIWQDRALWILGGLGVAIYPLAFYGAMRLAGVTIGTVVTIGAAPLFSALLEYLVDRAPLSRRWGIGAALGIAGIVLLVNAEGGGGATPSARGVSLGLLGAFTYALYAFTARRMMLRGLPSHVAMGATFGLGGLLLMPVLALTGGAFLATWGNAAVGLYMALVPMFLGYLAFGYGLARVRASTATTLTLFEPVVAALLAVWVVGEQLAPMGWTGVGLVGACLVCVSWPAKA